MIPSFSVWRGSKVSGREDRGEEFFFLLLADETFAFEAEAESKLLSRVPSGYSFKTFTMK